jgi:hypothetical protein
MDTKDVQTCFLYLIKFSYKFLDTQVQTGFKNLWEYILYNTFLTAGSKDLGLLNIFQSFPLYRI